MPNPELPTDSTDDDDFDEQLGKGLSNYLDMLSEMNEPVEAESFEAALEPDDGEYEWLIPTGEYNDEGRPLAVKVTAIDPKKQALLVAYTLSEDKEEAARSLWRACITEPEEITKKEVYDKLRTKFKVGVTTRLLDMLGQGADSFLATTNRRKQKKKGSMEKESGSQSQTDSDKTQESSEMSGQTKTSSTPTSTQESPKQKNAEPSSKTSASSSPAPSAKKTSNTQSSSGLGNVTVGTE